MMVTGRGAPLAWVVAAACAVMSVGCEKVAPTSTPVPTPGPSPVPGPKPTPAPTDARNDGPEPDGPPPAPTVKKNSKGDCQLAYAPRPTRDPNPLCKITGGTFMMGSDGPDAGPSEKPVRKVTLTPYFIDQFEVTNAQVAFFLNAVGNRCEGERNNRCFEIGLMSANSQFITEENGEFHARPDAAYLPVYSASVEGAERYCAWVGKRLPTEAEWEFAARHDPKTGKDYRWPWGDRFYPKRAACEEEVCKDGFYATIENEKSSDEAPVGTFDGTHGFGDGSSPWGVHDMAGNVSEIMADVGDFYEEPYPDCGTCIDPVMATAGENPYRLLRGPSGAVSVDSSITYRGGRTKTYEGFRCAYR